MSFKKKIFKFSISQKILAFIGYLYILFVCYTSKIQIINSELPEKLWRENKPFILAFWHGQLMMIGYVWKSKAVLNMLAIDLNILPIVFKGAPRKVIKPENAFLPTLAN